MAKKSRRARSKSPKAAQPVRIKGPAQPEPKAVKAQEVDFAKEYRYVVEDLRRIAITAAALLVLLIVLAILVG